MKRGDVILTKRKDSWISRAIVWFEQRISKDKHAEYSHAMLYAGDKMVWSQDLVYKLRKLSDYKKCDIRVFSFDINTIDIINYHVKVGIEANKGLGKPYDILGIVGQALTAITKVKFFRDLLHFRTMHYCSEKVILTLNNIYMPIVFKMDPQSTPDDINDYLLKNKHWVYKDYKKGEF